MITALVPVLFAASAFAAPIFDASLFKRAGSQCSVSNATLNVPSGLAAPTHSTSFIGVGVGTQNYTCSDSGTYVTAGAVATLFDISCLVGTPAFDNVQDVALQSYKSSGSPNPPPGLPTQPQRLGDHYFIANGASISPKWDFTSSQASADAFVVGAKVANVAAPTGSKDIDWLQLKSASGTLADEVYRVDTREGQPPASCTPGSEPITVKYTSKYWLFGGSFAGAQ